MLFILRGRGLTFQLYCLRGGGIIPHLHPGYYYLFTYNPAAFSPGYMGIDTAECGKEVYESLSNTNGEAILLIKAHLGLVTREGRNEKIKKDGKKSEQ